MSECGVVMVVVLWACVCVCVCRHLCGSEHLCEDVAGVTVGEHVVAQIDLGWACGVVSE